MAEGRSLDEQDRELLAELGAAIDSMLHLYGVLEDMPPQTARRLLVERLAQALRTRLQGLQQGRRGPTRVLHAAGLTVRRTVTRDLLRVKSRLAASVRMIEAREHVWVGPGRTAEIRVDFDNEREGEPAFVNGDRPYVPVPNALNCESVADGASLLEQALESDDYLLDYSIGPVWRVTGVVHERIVSGEDENSQGWAVPLPDGGVSFPTDLDGDHAALLMLYPSGTVLSAPGGYFIRPRSGDHVPESHFLYLESLEDLIDPGDDEPGDYVVLDALVMPLQMTDE